MGLGENVCFWADCEMIFLTEHHLQWHMWTLIGENHLILTFIRNAFTKSISQNKYKISHSNCVIHRGEKVPVVMAV
jgi:hypothetical protein